MFERQGRKEEDAFQPFNKSDFGSLAGAQSEPTTPPELRETNGFASYSRAARYSLSGSSMSSAIGFGTPFSSMAARTGSQSYVPTQAQLLMTPSLPGSRRNSDEEDEVDREIPSTNTHNGTRQ